MASQAAASFNGNLKKAVAGLRRVNLEGLRWRVFDAKSQVLGRLASQISTVIQGKDKPTYSPNRDDGDMCIVLNAKDVCVTGRKLTDKVYYWHTEYVGHLKERTLQEQMVKDPTEAIRKAVLRMLPRNKLRDDRDRKLRIFAGNEHPFDGWSGRTRMVAKYLHGSFLNQKKQIEEEVVNLLPIVEGRTMKESARLFYEILVLKTKGYVDVKQDDAYGDILIRKLPKWDQISEDVDQ